MLAAAMAGVPYSYTLHGPAELFEPMSWRIDLKIARAKFVACISWFARSQGMLFSDPGHWRKLHVVRCGVDPAVYDRPKGPPGGGLLFVGRLAAVKGLLVLFEAFETVRAAHPDATLTLIGDGPDRRALEADAARRGFGDAVVFAGYRSQEDVAQALVDADVFVLPSFAEGVPVVLMEALASRTPAVATRVAGVGELVEDGVSGFLVAPGDPQPLAARISQLLHAPALRRSMGAAGRARVVDAFDVAGQARLLRDLFDE
jgi:glycosyltransferase involved in cell wall biosynthesis